MLKTKKRRLKNLTYNAILIILLSSIYSCNSQVSENLTIKTKLPSLLKESSGIAALNNANDFWLINDSGNTPELFEMTINGDLKRVVKVKDVNNVDWEDLADDNKSQVFIGDFGNNHNLRRDLAIYIVDLKDIVGDKVTPEKVTFYFEDQEKFPPKKKHRNFDVEAFIYYQNAFYLFTKNRSSKFDGTTKLYRVPAISGNHEAKLLDSFKTCKDANDCLVTAADISNDGKTLVLLTHNKVFKFSGFSNDDFFKGEVEEIKLHHKTQKEAICFHENKLYLTDEATKKSGGNLYELLLQ